MSSSQIQNPPFAKQLELALTANDFTPTLILIRGKGYGRDKKKKEIFWASPLPERWANEIIDLPDGLPLLFDYFELDVPRPLFLKKAAESSLKLLERAIKISTAYRKEHHWQSFDFLQRHVNSRGKVFYRELKYLRQLHQHWEEREEFYRGVLQATDFEDILIHTVAYYERVPQTISNNALQTSKEITLCYVLNEMLTIKKQLPTGDKPRHTIEELRSKIEHTLPPINPPAGMVKGIYLPTEKIDTTKKLIRETIDFYFQSWVNKRQVDLYLCGYQDFEEIDGLEAVLRRNTTYAVQWRNDKKGLWQGGLFINLGLEHLPKEERTLPLIMKNAESIKLIKYGSFLRLPEVLPISKNDRLSLNSIFKILRGIAVSPTLDAEDAYSQYILVANEEILKTGVQLYIDEKNHQPNAYIDFLTTDLSASSTEDKKAHSVNVLTKPFLKVDDKYFWLSTLMFHRDWGNLMHIRIADEKLKGLHKEQATNLEALLSESFRDAKFNSISSWKNPKLIGEIDVLAYQDDTLFVIEFKATQQNEGVLSHAWYQAKRFEHKAFLQLKRAVKFIKNNYGILQQEEKLGLKTKLENLQIVPLIVSNVFEADDILIHDEYKKVSLFELQVILKNKLYDTLHNRMGSYIPGPIGDLYASHTFAKANRSNPRFKALPPSTPLSREECNLWSSKERCTPEDLLDAIHKQKVWRGLDEMMDFKAGEKITLEPYDPKVTFLNHPG